MDEDEAYALGRFSTAEEALAKCQSIVDDFLDSCTEQHDTADAIYQSYVQFGEDPVIIGRNGAPDVKFSAWSYAKIRAQDLARKGIDT